MSSGNVLPMSLEDSVTSVPERFNTASLDPFTAGSRSPSRATWFLGREWIICFRPSFTLEAQHCDLSHHCVRH